MLYCIEVKKEFEEDNCVLHHEFDKKPTREEILEFVINADVGYNDDYGKLIYYEVAPT